MARCMSNEGTNFKWIILLLIITFYGAILRLYDLGSQSFWMDEATSAIHGLAILKHCIPLLPNGVLSWNFAPAHYLIAAGILISDNIHTGARLLGSISGVILIPAVYFLSCQISRSRMQAIVSSGIVAVLYYEIGWSRQARMYSYMQLFTVAAIGFFFYFLDNRKTLYFLISGTLMILGIFTHPAGFIAPLIMAIAIILEIPRFKYWITWLREHPRFIVLMVILCAASILVFLKILDFSKAYFSKGLLPETYFPVLLRKYLRFIYFQLRYLVFWVVGGVLLSLVMFFTRDKKEVRRFVPLVLAAGCYLLIISAKVPNCHRRYILPIFIFFPIFASYLLVWLVKKIRIFKQYSYYRWAYTGITVAFAASLLSANLGFRLRSEYYLETTAPQPDWRRGYEWILEDAKTRHSNADKFVIATAFPRFNYIYAGEKGIDSYYLPCFWTPKSMWPVKDIAPYTKSITITNIGELSRLSGYVILDQFGLRRQRNPEIRRILQKKKYLHHIPSQGGFDLTIWEI